MLAYMEHHIGQPVNLLIEEQDAQGNWLGHTDNYLHVSINEPCQKNTIVSVLLEEIEGKLLKGKIID